MEDNTEDSKEPSGQAFSDRDDRRVRQALRYGIDLREIDRDKLTQGEEDVLGVFNADLGTERQPSPLIVGLMHMIQQKYGDATATEVTDREY